MCDLIALHVIANKSWKRDGIFNSLKLSLKIITAYL